MGEEQLEHVVGERRRPDGDVYVNQRKEGSVSRWRRRRQMLREELSGVKEVSALDEVDLRGDDEGIVVACLAGVCAQCGGADG